MGVIFMVDPSPDAGLVTVLLTDVEIATSLISVNISVFDKTIVLW